ncbi:MAG: TlpA family protein disulfide reductase [Thermoanaerobaculales bacterium]|nr:TlpA family protein disulfide reductase [Thermoanaerobaculales bacterium]
MELPRLQPLFEKYRDQGLEIIAVEGKRDTERARTFIAEHGLSYTMLENGEGEAEVASNLYKVRAYPSSFLIDRQGRVMYFHLGFEEGDEKRLEEEILSLL